DFNPFDLSGENYILIVLHSAIILTADITAAAGDDIILGDILIGVEIGDDGIVTLTTSADVIKLLFILNNRGNTNSPANI
ncbi:MAG: hypothetical protein IIB46_00250, partial [Nitrospinae bacterium]|nr:hypothetical protein [Nitrospinota bacterium]